MIEQLIGEWSCASDRVSFELIEDKLVVRAAWDDEEKFTLRAASRDGAWAYLVPSTDVRVFNEMPVIDANEFTVHWFNSRGGSGESHYTRVKPEPVGGHYCSEGCGHDFGRVFTPPIPCEGCEGVRWRGFDAGVATVRARIAAALGDEGPLASRLASFMPGVAAYTNQSETMVGIALGVLLGIIREELEVHDGE